MSEERRTSPEPRTMDLVRHAKVDPVGAFGELYSRIAPAVFAWASLHVRGPLRAHLDPEDVLQEVSYRAFRGLESFDAGRGGFREWVFGIARNVLLGAMRRVGSQAHPSSNALDTQALAGLHDSATSISNRVAREDGLRAFVARLEELDEDDRRLVVHRGLEGLTHEDVGSILGIAPMAAAKRWERLLRRLKDELGAPEIFVELD